MQTTQEFILTYNISPKIIMIIYINLELDKISVCLNLNKLTLNVDKPRYMTFHKRRKVEQVCLRIDNNIIENVTG